MEPDEEAALLGQEAEVGQYHCCCKDCVKMNESQVLDACESGSYTYECHAKSPGEDEKHPRYKRALLNLTNLFGRFHKLNLVPPMGRQHKKTLRSGDLFEVLANECMEQLYDDNTEGGFGEVGFLSFSRLHHMNLHYFEAELAAEMEDIVGKKNTDRQQMIRVRRRLREYSDAVGDYERVLNYWKQPPAGKVTAFHRSILPHPFLKRLKTSEGAWDNGYMPLSSSNQWAYGLVGRIAAALLGITALIVPVVIMAVGKVATKNLITTSVAILMVAAVLAYMLGSWRDVVGVTSAYAAILIVFVGTSTPPSQN